MRLLVSTGLLFITIYHLFVSRDLEVQSSLIATSQDDDGTHDWMIVATMFSDQPKYIAALGAQLDTWMAPIPNHRLFMVGPNVTLTKTPDGNDYPHLITITRPDSELWMKRLQQFAEAHRMLQSGVEFDWFLSGNEDWYVNVDKMKAQLDKHGVDPRQEAIVYSGFGCGQHWEYHKDSKNGTLPEPDYWPKTFICEGVEQHGGFCAGTGVVVTRKALEVIMQDGEAAFYAKATSLPALPTDDLVLSCVIYAYEGRVNQYVQIWRDVEGIREWNAQKASGTVAVMHARQHDPNGLAPAVLIRTVYAEDIEKKSSSS